MGRREEVGGFGGGTDRMIGNERKIRTKAEALGLCRLIAQAEFVRLQHQRTGWQPVGFPPLRDQEPAIVFLFTAPVSAQVGSFRCEASFNSWRLMMNLKAENENYPQ
jgi:hypothetical protein